MTLQNRAKRVPLYSQYAPVGIFADRTKGKIGIGRIFIIAQLTRLTIRARFTISEVAADWQEPVVLQRRGLSTARANGHWTRGCSQQAHHRPNQPHQAFCP